MNGSSSGKWPSFNQNGKREKEKRKMERERLPQKTIFFRNFKWTDGDWLRGEKYILSA